MSSRFLLVAAASLLMPAAALAQTAADPASDPAATDTQAASDQSADPSGDQPAADQGSDADADAPTRGWGFSSGSSSAPAASSATRRPTTPVGNVIEARGGSAAPGLSNVSLRDGHAVMSANFALNSANLTPSGRRDGDRLFAELHKSYASASHYLVSGHSDASGDETTNLMLSRMRAEAMVDYLVDKGMPREQFRARGYGSERPLPRARASASSNRRVEITRLD